MSYFNQEDVDQHVEKLLERFPSANEAWRVVSDIRYAPETPLWTEIRRKIAHKAHDEVNTQPPLTLRVNVSADMEAFNKGMREAIKRLQNLDSEPRHRVAEEMEKMQFSINPNGRVQMEGDLVIRKYFGRLQGLQDD